MPAVHTNHAQVPPPAHNSVARPRTYAVTMASATSTMEVFPGVVATTRAAAPIPSFWIQHALNNAVRLSPRPFLLSLNPSILIVTGTSQLANVGHRVQPVHWAMGLLLEQPDGLLRLRFAWNKHISGRRARSTAPSTSVRFIINNLIVYFSYIKHSHVDHNKDDYNSFQELADLCYNQYHFCRALSNHVILANVQCYRR